VTDTDSSTETTATSPPRAAPGRALKILRGLVLGLSILWALIIAVVFAVRVGFPLELEWMEGGTLQQAWRVQRGLPVYGPPSPAFVPFLYTPLYPALVAALGFVFPLGLPLARAVSILAVIATCAGLWRLCAIEDKPRAHRALAVGLFLSAYVFSFRWLDLARGDSLFLALVLWGLILLREAEDSWAKTVLAGVLIAAAFWTKQTAAVFVLASGVGGLLVAPRRVWVYAGVIAVLAGGGVLLGQHLTEGWLWTWIYEMHQTHAFNEVRFREKTWGMFVHASPFMALLLTALVGVALGLALRRAKQLARAVGEQPRGILAISASWLRGIWAGMRATRGPIYWALLAFTGLLVSALGYSTQFAEPNAFIPGVCFGAAFFGVALPDSTLRRDELAGLHGPRRIVEHLGLALVAAQLIFALLVEPMYQPIQSHGLEAGLRHSYAWQDPRRTLPSRAQREAARELRATIEALDGDRLLALHRPWWPILAGGDGHVGAMGITDVRPEQRRELQRAILDQIRSGEIRTIWIEGNIPRWFAGRLSRWTVHERRWGEQRVRPMSGWMSEAGMVTPWRGEQLLLGPPRDRELPPGASILADFESGTFEGFEVVSGIAFGRRPSRGLSRRGLPPIGPHGGAYLLSSAASGRRQEAIGEVRSPPFRLPAGGALELLVGTSGTDRGLEAKIVGEDGQEFPLDLPRTRMDLRTVRFVVPPALAGQPLRLHLRDRSKQAAIFVDDLWLFMDGPSNR